jgi:hypothetical protein
LVWGLAEPKIPEVSHFWEKQTFFSFSCELVMEISNGDTGHQGFPGSNIYWRASSSSADSHPKAEP